MQRSRFGLVETRLFVPGLGRRGRWRGLVVVIAAMGRIAAACGGSDDGRSGAGSESQQADAQAEQPATADLSGTIAIAGSSTVFPIAEAWAEDFGIENRRVRVNVASIGSGAGFERFCNSETDVSNASRAMKASQAATCANNGVDLIEIPVAFDGPTVAVNIENDWVDFLTLDELARIFGPAGAAKTWAEVRDGWPDERIRILSTGSDSGTFDYFSDTVNGEAGVQSTQDTQFSEDDNVLVLGIDGEASALAYFGFAYFVGNRERVRAAPIHTGVGAIGPTSETIESGTYAPLSRPLSIYVKVASLVRPEVRAVVEWALTTGRRLIGHSSVGDVQLPGGLYAASLARVASGDATGALAATATAGATLEEIRLGRGGPF